MRCAVTAVTTACMLTALANFSHGQVSQPASLMPVDYSIDYYNQPGEEDPIRSPSDARITPPATLDATKATKGDASCGCDASKDRGGKGCGCGGGLGILPCNPCDDAWTLFPNDNCHGITVGGWTQAGYHTAGANGNGTGLFNKRPNEVQLHQMWVFAEKEVDTGGCGWDVGFRIDYVYGTDGPDTQAFGNAVAGGNQGWDNEWDNGADYGHAIPQLYAEVGVNDWKFKIGHFYTIIGYEVVTAPDNFFYSKAITMVNNEPFTHTGVLGEWAFNDCTTLYIGYTLGWDTGFDRDGGSSVILGSSRQVRDNLTITSAVIFGNFGFQSSGPAGGGAGSDPDAYMTSTVIDWVINDSWEYVLQYDFQDNQNRLAPVGQAYAVNQYLFYTVNDCVKLGVRAEWSKIGPTDRSEITAGMNYRPHSNLVIRPEVRWEFGNLGGIQDTTLFGVDAIMTF